MEAAPTEADRPVLLLLSETSDLPQRLRSQTHDVRCWSTDAQNAGSFTGDPTEPQTYAWTREARSITAIINLLPAERARSALRALRHVRSDAAVLILSDEVSDVDGDRDGTLARSGELRDVLRLHLDEEVARLEAERRAYCLRSFAAQTDVVPILIHDDPDPDAVSSALGVAALLGSTEHAPIVTLDEVRRPENRRMVDLLSIRVTRVTLDELRRYSHVITVDMQPDGLQLGDRPRLAVIDHHPRTRGWVAEFADVRPGYGSTASIVTEYLRAVMPDRIRGGLATSLLFGIRTDTASLMRGASPADVDAYAFLQQHADQQLIHRFEQPSYALESARAFGSALAEARCGDGVCAAWLGELAEDAMYVQTELADFCLAIETITWVVIGAHVGEEIVLTLRHSNGGEDGAGAVARTLAAGHGRGGGHAIMARVALPIDVAAGLLPREAGESMPAVLHRVVSRTIDQVAGGARRAR